MCWKLQVYLQINAENLVALQDVGILPVVIRDKGSSSIVFILDLEAGSSDSGRVATKKHNPKKQKSEHKKPT